MSAPLPKEMNFRDRLESAGVGVREKLYLQPTNGSTFTSGSTFSEFHIPGNRANTFADLKNLYVEVALTTAIDQIYLDCAGSLNMVERIECDTTSGVRVFETRNKDVIDNLKLIEQNTILELAGSGAVLMGTRNNQGTAGVSVSAAASKVLVIPIVNVPMNNYWPMIGNDGLRFRIHWASALNFVIEDTSTDVLAGSFSITNVKMHYDTIKLSDEDMNELIQETDGRFVITGNSFQNQQEVATTTALVANLGFGRSKCKKIYVALRSTAALSNKVQSSHSFDCHTLTSAELRYNGRLINESGLSFTAGNAAVVLAELIKQRGGSLVKSQGIIEVDTWGTAIPTALFDAQVGSFFIAFDLTSGADTHLSESGLDTRTGTFQLNLTAGTALTHTVDIFCEYETKLVLDMKADRVFRVMS